MDCRVLTTGILDREQRVEHVQQQGRVSDLQVAQDGSVAGLQITEAMDSTDFALGPVNPWIPAREPAGEGNIREGLSRCPFFALERWRLSRPAVLGQTGPVHHCTHSPRRVRRISAVSLSRSMGLTA